MPQIFEDDLRRDISSGRFAPVYLIYGDDSYLKNHYKDLISKKAADGDPFFNLQKFEGDCDLQEVFDAVNQFPMMAERKSVVLSDFDFSKGDYDRFLELISNANDTCVLILCFDTVEFDSKKGNKEKKIISAVEKAGGKCAEINHRTVTALVKMLADGAKKRGCSLGEIAARHLIEVSGTDLSTLQNELNKLCAFVGNGDVTKDIIEQIAVKSVDASIYDYVRQIFVGDISSALKMLYDMFFMRIEPIVILSVTASSYVDIYRAYTANLSGVSKADIADDFKYPKNKLFLIDRAVQNLKKFNGTKLSLSLECIAEADKLLKSFGADAQQVLEQLTVKLVYILTKGESVD